MLGMILGFCSDTQEVWAFVGKIVTLLKILIPVIIIVLGIVAFVKAALADDSSKEMTKAVTALVMKFVTGVIIFFIPTIVRALFNFTGTFASEQADYTYCVNCITGSCSN